MGLETSTLIALGSAAASGVGSMINMSEMRADQEARAAARMQALREHQARQKTFQDENRKTYEERAQDYTPENQGKVLQNAQDARTEDITQGVKGPTTDVALTGSAPSVVEGELAKRMLTAFNKSTDQAKALGKLGGYGDQWFTNNMGLLDSGRKIDTVNSFSRQEAALLPGYQDLAEAGAARAPSGIGTIMSGLGQIGGYYAGAKAKG